MKNDYIRINKTEEYRIEFNWNALSDFLEHENISLAEIDKVDNLKPGQITSLIYFAVKEGARMEGKDFNYDVKQFGASLSPADMADLLVIYRRQSEVESKVSGSKKKGMKFI